MNDSSAQPAKCLFELQPMLFCRRDAGHLGAHRFSQPIERMILAGKLPMPPDWKAIGIDKLLEERDG